MRSELHDWNKSITELDNITKGFNFNGTPHFGQGLNSAIVNYKIITLEHRSIMGAISQLLLNVSKFEMLYEQCQSVRMFKTCGRFGRYQWEVTFRRLQVLTR